jgi:DNA polymerase III subunit alpha, Gram-positive type
MQKKTAKGFTEVFENLEWDLEIDPLIQGTWIDEVHLHKSKGSVDILAFAERYIPFAHISSIEQKLKEFLQCECVQFKVRFPKEKNLKLLMDLHFEDILNRMKKSMPVGIGILQNTTFEVEEPNVLKLLVNGSGKSVLEAKGFVGALERILMEIFDVRARVILIDGEEVKQSLHHEDAIIKNEIIKMQKEEATQPKDRKSQEKPKSFLKQGDKASKSLAAHKNQGVLLGKSFGDPLIKIHDISLDSGTVAFKGKVFRVETRNMKDGEKCLLTFDITDFEGSVTVKSFLKIEKYKAVSEHFKEDATLVVRGDAQYDKFSRELSILAKDILLSEGEEVKKDDAPKKRVELHLHTQMSAMDAVTSIKDYIKRAVSWGHKAIAITDHGVVQGYPDAMDSAQKHGIKMLYGVECYLLDDAMPALLTYGDMPFSGSFVVFDVETTGLNPSSDRLIEIGAVKIQNFQIVDSFNTFVNPGIPIPPFITKLTSIHDDMVKDAPLPKEALASFLEFTQDSVLVAHNANFDMGFIRLGALREGLAFQNPLIDTVTLSRRLLPELKKHKLNIVAKHFGIALENHHRAVDDALATAKIFLKFLETLGTKGCENIKNMDKAMSGEEDYKSFNTYHAVILVQNQKGLRNLYQIISESHLNYFHKKPRVPKKLLSQNREGLLVGSACESGELYRAFLAQKTQEDIERIASFYDYLEIQPLSNNRFLIEKGLVSGEEELCAIHRKIVDLGKKLDKLVVATSDAHYLDPQDAIYRNILMTGQRMPPAFEPPPLHFRTTDEMLLEFSYLGEEDAYAVVVENTNQIADRIEEVRPIPKGTFPPKMEGSSEEIKTLAEGRAKAIYGDPLPELVDNRLAKELRSIIQNNFSVLYMISQKLVAKSLADGYLVGSRGSVGSSFVANMAGITEVNSLPPHYICEHCKYSEFIEDGSVGCGFDLPEKKCPSCGHALEKDGYDIPFETFLGLEADKEPDIDLNFSGEYQAIAHKYTEELFGEGHVYRAGTIGTIAEKTAFGYVKGYMEDKNRVLSQAEMARLVKGCTGVKRTTGQHPGGVMIVPQDHHIYEFSPIQRPADDPNSSIITTHFDYHSISGRLLKLDILGHDDPTMIRMLEDLTGVDARKIPIGDKKTMDLFRSTHSLDVSPEDILSPVGTLAVPEFGTKFVRQMLVDTMPTTFSELIRISGLSHGTDVWLNNAQVLVKNRVAKLAEVISTRDDIMLYLMYEGVLPKTAFKIMEDVRKGKGLKQEYVDVMEENGIPDWYIDSCNKIKYMFPKAHAAAYVMMAFRIAWFKVYHPIAFYVAYYTVRADEFDAMIMAKGKHSVMATIREYEMRGNDLTQKEKNLMTILEVVNEMYARGIRFLPVDLYESEAKAFQMVEGAIRIPFNALQGLGENAAKSILEARKNGRFISVDDLRMRAKLSKTVIDILKVSGALEGLPESNQLSLFDADISTFSFKN